MKFLSTPDTPVVTALPSPGIAGRLLSLLSDGHLYHDTGDAWDDLSVQASHNMPWVRTGSSAYHMAGDVAGAALFGATASVSTIYYTPFSVPRKLALTQMGFAVLTAAAGTARVGIYANDGSGATDVPGALLAEGASTLDTSTTGTKLASISITLDPGVIYWAAVICSGQPAWRVLDLRASGGAPLGRATNGVNAYTHLTQAGSGSTLPATAGPSFSWFTNGGSGPPGLYLVP